MYFWYAYLIFLFLYFLRGKSMYWFVDKNMLIQAYLSLPDLLSYILSADAINIDSIRYLKLINQFYFEKYFLKLDRTSEK